MIISDGELVPDGTGGNYYIQFNNDGYTYQVWRNYLTDSAKKPRTLWSSITRMIRKLYARTGLW